MAPNPIHVPVAMLGMGSVGSAVAHLLSHQQAPLRRQSGIQPYLKHVVVRDPNKPRSVRLPTGVLSDRFARTLEDPEIKIVIELTGAMDLAFEMITRLLRAGKDVVTANKALLCERGNELFGLAAELGRTICFEASVGGGIPIVAALSEGLAGNRIELVSGILNGTTNFILTKMHDESLAYEQALQAAREMGFAEADPTRDVDGTDAAQKLALLCRLAFQSRIDFQNIRRRGIDALQPADIRSAAELGYVIKLLALAGRCGDDLSARVAPTLVSKRHPMAQVSGEYNAIEVVGDAVGDTLFYGRGAGGMATASSVIADVIDLALGRARLTFQSLGLADQAPPGPRLNPCVFLPSRFYLRYTIEDRPGTLALIAGILGRHGVSIATVRQPEVAEASIGGSVPLIIMTHIADEGGVWGALVETDALPVVRQPTICFHVAE